MYKLFLFILKNQRTFLFILLEAVCFTLLFTFNNYQGASFFNTSNQMVGSVYAAKREAEDYVGLKYQNEKLAEENAYLRSQLNRNLALVENDTLAHMRPEKTDNIRFVATKVVNSTNTMVNNY